MNSKSVMIHQLTVNRMTIDAGVLSSVKNCSKLRKWLGRYTSSSPHIHDSIPTLFCLRPSAPAMVPLFDGSTKVSISTYLFGCYSTKWILSSGKNKMTQVAEKKRTSRQHNNQERFSTHSSFRPFLFSVKMAFWQKSFAVSSLFFSFLHSASVWGLLFSQSTDKREKINVARKLYV